MIAAQQLQLNVATVTGLLILGVCVFVAGWVSRGEYDLWRRVSRNVGTHRRWSDSDNDRGGFIGRTPW